MRRISKSAIFMTVLTSFAAAAPMSALANVSLRNGNFFVGYTDIVYPGGYEPKIERIYNSKTNYASGMFGPGWGFEYEVYLKVEADGSVVVHEYGGGAENHFQPASFVQAEFDKSVDAIVNATRGMGALGSEAEITRYRNRLKSDISFRNDEWEKLRAGGKLQARKMPVGTRLQSNRFSYQFITKTADGYVRTFETGKTEYFNDAGHLVKVGDKNGNSIAMTYGTDGKLQRLVDNFGRRMAFSYNNKGRVTGIDGENNKKATYEYDNAGRLIRSKDTSDNVYAYKYDTDPTTVVPNMVEIDYADNTNVKISYYGNDKLQNVKTYKDRDGTVSEYTYGNNPSDPGYYAVTVGVKGTNGKKISTSKYEYYLKRKATGEEWQYKLITTIDGDRTETTNNECCGLPLLINHNGEETSFVYDTKGHVTKKTTPNEVTELTYHPTVGKITKVVRFAKTEPKKASWSAFDYDPKGNLIFAKNSDKKGVRLFYDNVGRIRSMVDQDRRRIDFKYNENSKPVEISDPALGTINVSYNNSGEIKKVESTAGRKIAVQVTSAFQNLLEILRPAGVTLQF